MIFLRRLVISIILILFLPAGLASDETNGFIRLILHEKTGRFSLLFLSDKEKMVYEPFFNSRNPKASFLSVSVNGKAHRLGDTRKFTTAIERQNGNPAIVFKSKFLTVSEVFSLIKTPNSQIVNGIMITVTVQNTDKKEALIGLRMLIDTDLGEKRRKVPFFTNKRTIEKETLIEGASGEKFWVSSGENVSLMGSIINPLDLGAKLPSVHIANWKRLNGVSWKLRYSENRSLSKLPFSIRDSAVCYYYEPSTLETGETFVYKIILSTEDIEWYNSVGLPYSLEEDIEAPTIDIAAIEQEAIVQAAETGEDSNVLFLLKLQALLERFIAGRMKMNKQDLKEIEKVIERLKS